MTTPTFSQIRAQVAAIRRHDADARLFGIRIGGRWTGERIRSAGNETYCIVQCDSPLQMRAALQEQQPGVTATVLVTNVPDEQISYDIRVRLARRKFYTINNWQIVKELFQARYIDPRVVEQGWIAERLLEAVPHQGYLPVPNGVLDAETVWGLLLEQQLGLATARPDLVALLKWSMDAENTQRYVRVPGSVRQAVKAWIAESAGLATEAVLECVQASQRPDALPVGLALSVVYHRDAAGKLDKAAGRMEKYVGQAHLDEPVARQWQAAATEVVRLHVPDAKARAAWLQRADEILQAVEADDYAHLSPTSPLGYNQRLARFGKALADVVESSQPEIPQSFHQAYRDVIQHDLSQKGSRAVQRVEMAARLARWLVRLRGQETSVAASLAEAAREYATAGGFIDWGRHTLRGGEPVRELAEAYTRLLTKVTQIVEQKNRRFAQLLRDWIAAGSKGDDVLPVERVLDEVVAPLAAQTPVLVLVIDGMSYAVFRELVEDITRQDWAEIRRQDRGAVWPGIAAVPSVTEVCRASLLCGRLRQGQASDEKTGFAEHPGLLRHCRSGASPVLFHKDALQETSETSLAEGVIREIESPRRRVVGVVINAVDDHLLKGDQLDIRWSGDEIKVLPKLLYEARAAGRIVVLATDHGHVLDFQTECRPHEPGDRWRSGGDAPADDEIQIAGPRVVLPESHRLVAPWSERVRYSIKKNGYHGGVSMQEMVIPVAVLTAQDELPEGWVEPPSDAPVWWFPPLEEQPAADVGQPVVVAKPPRKKKPGMLFDLEDEAAAAAKAEPVAAGVAAPVASPAWLDQLFTSAVLAEQKKLGGRAVPQDETVRKMLGALAEQGGKLTSAALARRMGLPAYRLASLLAAIQRVVNVEGYPILTRDELSDTIELNRELLCRQFELP